MDPATKIDQKEEAMATTSTSLGQGDMKDVAKDHDSTSSGNGNDEPLAVAVPMDLEKGQGGKDDAEQEKVQLKTKPFIVLVACCAALGGLIFGYDIAGT